jgi:hypothetical protein
MANACGPLDVPILVCSPEVTDRSCYTAISWKVNLDKPLGSGKFCDDDA